MNSTNAVDVSIHDVSPELSSSAEILKEISNTNSVEIKTFTIAPKEYIYLYAIFMPYKYLIYAHQKGKKKRRAIFYNSSLNLIL